QGMEIPIYYDPMIAKLVAYGKDRTEAIERMIRAIDEYQVTGITTTLGFGKFVMQHDAFVSGKFDTHFVKKYFPPDVLNESYPDEERIAAMLMAKLLNAYATVLGGHAEADSSNWVKNRKQLS
ncbi:MAG: biotin carboxylase, partial [Bacteroidetes bacterium]|nr:biotin carboxylase [Bacteroidota bacterium]